MLTRDQKEAIVIEMLNAKKPIRDIAKEIHMSFSDIGGIKRRVLGESAPYRKKKKLSKVAQVFDLISKNKTPIAVTVELDLDPQDVKKIYINYLGLNGLTQLVNIHQELGSYLPDFISFYWSCREFGADNKKIKEIVDISNRAPELKSEIHRLQFERKNLEIEIERKNKKLQNLDYQIEETTNVLNTQYANYENLWNDTDKLRTKLQNLKKLFKDIENKGEYQNLEKKVEDMVMKIVDDKSINLPLILIAVFEELRNDPSKYEIIFNYLDDFKNDNISGEDLQLKENYLYFNNINLFQEIDKISKKLCNVYANKIISNMTRPDYN
jgi:DNA repair exonuclease SbcCD ATPase subunit